MFRIYSSLLFLILLLVLTYIPAHSQDTIEFRSGDLKTGKAIIQYQQENDLVLIESQDEFFPASEVEQISFENGSVLVSKQLSFFDETTSTIITKYAFVDILLEGTASLFTYKGNGFNFGFTLDNEVHVLQNFDQNNENVTSPNYKIVLLNTISDCVERDEIFTSELKKNTLIYFFNTYNFCSDDTYLPNKIGKEKKRILSAGLRVGPNFATHDFKASIRGRELVTLPLQGLTYIFPTKGKIDQNEIISRGFFLNSFIEKNIGNSERFFFHLGFSFRSYEFDLEPEQIGEYGLRLNRESISFREVSLNTALNYKFSLKRKLYPEITLGAFFWTLGQNSNVINESEFNIINSGEATHAGLGTFTQVSLNYSLTTSTSLFVSFDYMIRNTENILIEDSTEQKNHSMTNNYAFTFGIRLTSIKTGFF